MATELGSAIFLSWVRGGLAQNGSSPAADAAVATTDGQHQRRRLVGRRERGRARPLRPLRTRRRPRHPRVAGAAHRSEGGRAGRRAELPVPDRVRPARAAVGVEPGGARRERTGAAVDRAGRRARRARPPPTAGRAPPLPLLRCPAELLPTCDESWAWAHAQVVPVGQRPIADVLADPAGAAPPPSPASSVRPSWSRTPATWRASCRRSKPGSGPRPART